MTTLQCRPVPYNAPRYSIHGSVAGYETQTRSWPPQDRHMLLRLFSRAAAETQTLWLQANATSLG